MKYALRLRFGRHKRILPTRAELADQCVIGCPGWAFPALCRAHGFPASLWLCTGPVVPPRHSAGCKMAAVMSHSHSRYPVNHGTDSLQINPNLTARDFI